MSNGIPSLFKWRSQAEFDRLLENHERAKQQNITVEELENRDEAQRLEKLPDPIEPENQQAITAKVEKTNLQKALNDYGWSEVDHDDKEIAQDNSFDWGEYKRYAETMSPDEPDYHADTNEKEWFESAMPEQEQSHEPSMSEPTELEPDI